MNFDLNSLLFPNIPLFLAIEVSGVVPTVLSVSEGMSRDETLPRSLITGMHMLMIRLGQSEMFNRM